jgi:hypothetical protein
VCAAIEAGSSVLVLAEAGMWDSFPALVRQRFEGQMAIATVTYKGSGKRFFEQLAEQLNIPTTEPKLDKDGEAVGEKAMTMDALKDEIADNVGSNTLLILPEAKRLTTGIRYWLEDLMAAGARLCCLAPVNPCRDIFLEMIEIELELPSDADIRDVMATEAQRQGLSLSKARLAELQPLAGRNPMLARKVVQNERLGLNRRGKPEHTQYMVIMPIIIAVLMAFGIVRFIGLGTSNQGLYILGGVTLVSGMTLRQLGNVRGTRKRLGQ